MTAPRPGTPRRIMATRRAWATIINTGTIECRRCHRIIRPGDKWELGHPPDNPYANGNQDQDLKPEHRHCNRTGIVKPKPDPTFGW